MLELEFRAGLSVQKLSQLNTAHSLSSVTQCTGSRVVPSVGESVPGPLPTLSITFFLKCIADLISEMCWLMLICFVFRCWFYSVSLFLNPLTPVHCLGGNSKDKDGLVCFSELLVLGRGRE